jgi:hypothetical protein
MANTIDCNTNMYVSLLGGLTESCIGGGLGLADNPCAFSPTCIDNHCDFASIEYSFLIPGPLDGNQPGDPPDPPICDCSEHEGLWILDHRAPSEFIPLCTWRYDETTPDCNNCTDFRTFELHMSQGPSESTVFIASAWGRGGGGGGGCSLLASWRRTFSSVETLDCLGSFTLPLTVENVCFDWPDPLIVTAV